MAGSGDVLERLEEIWDNERNAKPASLRLRDKSSLIQNLQPDHIHSLFNPVVSSGTIDDTSLLLDNRLNFSRTDISKLTSIFLNDMQTHRIHKGRFLLCRVVGAVEHSIGAELVVEDQQGRAVNVLLLNPILPLQPSYETVEALFPDGQLLAIREPWLRGAVNKCAIRVHSSSDILFLSGSEPLVHNATWASSSPPVPYITRNASELKALGTALFKKRFFLPAARVWSLAIEKDPKIPELFNNRAQAYMNLGWYSPALRDAEHVIAHFPPTSAASIKANFRAGNALYELNQYSAAFEKFQTVRDDEGARKWEAKCRRRLNEEIEGNYRWSEMFEQSQADIPRLDVAPYMGSIRVEAIAGRGGGRGVIATEQIRIGDLLLVAKPFASCFAAEMQPRKHPAAFNLDSRNGIEGHRLGAVWNTMATLQGAPERLGEIDGLYAGRGFPSPPARYPSPSPSSARPFQSPLLPSVDIDLVKIFEIVNCNAFGVGPLRPHVFRPPPPPDPGSFYPAYPEGSALYTLGSLFNHACLANAQWRTFGDVMVFRAVRDISPGSEITISYRDFEPYHDRMQSIGSWMAEGDSCNCVLCGWDRLDGDRECERRAELWERALHERPMNATTMADIIRNLKETYEGSRSVRSIYPELFEAHRAAQVIWIRAQLAKTKSTTSSKKSSVSLEIVEHGFDALSSAGYVRIDRSTTSGVASTRRRLPVSKRAVASTAVHVDSTLEVMLKISLCFVELLHDTVRAERWFRAAWWAHDLEYGGGQDLFSGRFKEFIASVEFPPSFLSGLEGDYGWEAQDDS